MRPTNRRPTATSNPTSNPNHLRDQIAFDLFGIDPYGPHDPEILERCIRIAKALEASAPATVAPRTGRWAWIGRRLRAVSVGCVVGGLVGALAITSVLAVHATREVNRLAYTVRHDVGDPDYTRIATHRGYARNADGELETKPCRDDVSQLCNTWRVVDVRDSIWQVAERQDGRIHELEDKLQDLSAAQLGALSNISVEEARLLGSDQTADILRANQEFDSDGDGVKNGIDACIDVPGDVGESKEQFDASEGDMRYGCPDGDLDKDGIPDYADKCPGSATGARVEGDLWGTFDGPKSLIPPTQGCSIEQIVDQCTESDVYPVDTTKTLIKGCPYGGFYVCTYDPGTRNYKECTRP